MNRLLLLIPLLLPATGVAYQQPSLPTAKPAGGAPAKQTEPLVPKRQIKFETSSEELAMTLFEADPKLLEQRYMAEATLSVPTSEVLNRSAFGGKSEDWQKAFVLLQSVHHFRSLLEVIGNDRMPPDEDVRTLARDARFVLVADFTSSRQVHTYNYRLLAPTPERAKELTQALFRLFDQGVTEPIQKELKRLKEDHETKLEEYRVRLAAAQVELDALKEIKNPEVLEPQAINDLKTQRRLLEVDLAGVKARIEACETILNRGTLSNTRRDQVENVKIAAEIELAGLAARQKTLDTIIDQAQKSLDLSSKLKRAFANVDQLQRSVRSLESHIATHTDIMKELGPFRLVDDKVVIRPIKWEAKPSDR